MERQGKQGPESREVMDFDKSHHETAAESFHAQHQPPCLPPCSLQDHRTDQLCHTWRGPLGGADGSCKGRKAIYSRSWSAARGGKRKGRTEKRERDTERETDRQRTEINRERNREERERGGKRERRGKRREEADRRERQMQRKREMKTHRETKRGERQ